MNFAIEAEGLIRRFGKTLAVDGVDLAVPPGKVLGLLGPNGAGKTTVVRMLATLLRPDAGSAKVCGADIVRDADRVRELIGLTGQYAAVDEDLTGFENLLLIGRLLEIRRAEAKKRATELLDRFDLADAGGRSVKTYSGGMRRRLDLAASLVQRPQVLFLDEPTTGLDPRSRGEVWMMIRELIGEGTTVLLTTQYLDEADRLASEIAVIDHGKVIASGTSAELKAKVGKQTLDVRPADPADLVTVTSIVSAAVGVAPVVSGEDPGLLSAPVDDAGALPVVVSRLQAERIEVTELALRLASLDEVFMALTGHAAVAADPALTGSTGLTGTGSTSLTESTGEAGS
ncbi:MAG TPA: ATP-binding cassette domain-containing protein [Streptosporangiaceae bacterium]|nr:ATP-binding cassette domain-containing protein [Streptosporangiaceae bacterium]